MIKAWKLVVYCSVLILFTQPGAQLSDRGAYDVTGKYTTHLTKPVDEPTASAASAGALSNLRREIYLNLRETAALDWDTTRAVDALHLQRLTDQCREHAIKASSFNGPEWTLSYTLTAPILTQAVQGFNEKNDTLAAMAYRRFTESSIANDPSGMYLQGLKALVFGSAHIGSPLQVPGELGIPLVERVRQTVDSLLGKISISSDIMVLDGRPGKMPVKPVTIKITNNGQPMPAMLIGGFISDGRQLFLSASDENGEIALDSLKLPYVANGSFFNIKLMPGSQIDPAFAFALSDINVRLRNIPSHALMFKLSRPTFVLAYQTSSATVPVPSDFASDAVMKNYLRDSCHLQTTGNAMNADLAFDIKCQISQYYYDEREETVVKVEMMVTVEDRTVSPPLKSSQTGSYEKPYKLGVDIPIGLFFWETTRELQKFAKSVLQDF